MISENLIFDRTETDLLNKTEKAYYNFNDLNRIESWCQYLAGVLNNYNYFADLSIKTNWTREDFPTELEMERIRNNIKSLKNAYYSFTNISENLDYMTFQKANDIEKIFFEIDKIASGMENYFIYSGVYNSGAEKIIQQNFRKSKTWLSQPYKLSQYKADDTVSMIATINNKTIKEGTQILSLSQIDKRDDVYASATSINDSMKTLDNLVGYECDYYTLVNLIKDSSFENNEWNDGVYSNSEKKYGNRSLYFSTGTTVVATINVDRPIIGHKYYGRRYIKTEGENNPADCRFELYGGDGENLNWIFAWNQGNYSEWGFDSAINEIVSVAYDETMQTIVRCFNVSTTANTWIDGLMIIDLTESFGAGNEPSKEWCDLNIPYFDGVHTIKVRKGE